MRRLFAMLGTLAAVGSASADDLTWKPAVSLWKSLSTNGQVIAAGPAPAWTGEKPPEPPAKLGAPSRPAPEGLPRPRELPDNLSTAGPTLPPLPSPTRVEAPKAPSKRAGRESFASWREDAATSPPIKPAR